MDPAVIIGFGMDKIGKRMSELLADPQVSATQALDVMWKEIEDYEAARQAQLRARYEDSEDDYDEYADDSEEDDETEASGGEAGEPGDDEKKKNPRLEVEAPRILLSRL